MTISRALAFAMGIISVWAIGPALAFAQGQDDDKPDLAKLPAPANRAVDFAKDVRPILAGRCWKCHGEAKQRGGLALHHRDRALVGGDSGPALVAGKSAESLMIHHVAGLEPDLRMPPPEAGDPLDAERIGILRAWIDQGAKWDETAPASSAIAASSSHWSFRKPVKSEPPKVRDEQWPRNPIDRFILARLEREGLQPSPEADRITLIRRLHLDLTGLPPSVADVDAFLKDERPDAWERLVDRLLASPEYGERWARLWLDRARYADTNGYEKDRNRSIWPYRDWVINALNADMPFDRFTIEQIAGDLLPNASLSQKIATGFHRNTMINEEGGIDVEEFRHAAVVDRVNVTATVWLGLTVGCAQCHTHKFDPITQREYYQFMAFLNNADEPEIDVPDPTITAKRREIAEQIAKRESELESQFPDGQLPGKMAEWEARVRTSAADWTILRPTRVASKNHATMTVLDDGSVLATGDKPNNDSYEAEIAIDFEGATALRLEVLTDPSLPDNGPGRAPLFSVGDFLLTEFMVKSERGPLKLRNASQDYSEANKTAALAIDGVEDTGWAVKGKIGEPHAAVFEFAEPAPRGELTLTLDQMYIHQMTIGRFRISAAKKSYPVQASGLTADLETIVLKNAEDRTADEQAALKRHFLKVAPELADANKAIEKLKAAMPRHPNTMVMRERDARHARTTRIHHRGEFLSPRDPVTPGVPAVLHRLPTNAPANRLTFAEWLVDAENPLTSRVIVNQIWQSYFGRGLVRTPEDFGTRGAQPSHPELLDWLAVEFREQGWSLKKLHRLIVASASYRQSSRTTPQRSARDPNNELLARGARFRVDAETVRDIALTASGLLHRKIGGPSVFPPQPEGVTAIAYGQAAWPVSQGPDRYRRGLYTFIKRTAPYAAFAAFDMPTSEACSVRRERSNTPLQALTVLNDAVFVEASQALAKRVRREQTTDADRIEQAFRHCLARRPTPEESRLLAAFLARQRAWFADPAHAEDAAALAGSNDEAAENAAWTALARAILNLDETLTKE